MQVFLQYSVFSGPCAKCTKWKGRFSTSFRDLTLDISKVRVYNGHIKNEGGARDEAFCKKSESVEPYRCCCVRTGMFLRLQGIRIPRYRSGRCHSGCVHFYLPACKPYRTCTPCGARTCCTCGPHYAATEYGRKQKGLRGFRAAERGIETQERKRLCFLQSRYCFEYPALCRYKYDFMLCKTQLKNIKSQRGKK